MILCDTVSYDLQRSQLLIDLMGEYRVVLSYGSDSKVCG